MTTDRFAFKKWQKIPRLKRDITITEKIDGTNAHIFITRLAPDEVMPDAPVSAVVGEWLVFAGSRTRYITPDNDNFGFAQWVRAHADTLIKLGEGRHYGEWWGRGIQRGYGLQERRFSLFNTKRWKTQVTPEDKLLLGAVGVGAVPVLAEGPFDDALIVSTLGVLRGNGSVAAPGFEKPEGIVVFHSASGMLFKRTIEGDEAPKTAVAVPS